MSRRKRATESSRSKVLGIPSSAGANVRTRRRRGTPTKPPVRAKGKTPQLPLPFTDTEIIKNELKGPTFQAFRGGDYLHVSDLLHKCLRRLAISKRLNRPIPPEPIFDMLGLTFAQGDAIHDYITRKVTERCPEKVYAKWSCRCGETVFTGTKKASLCMEDCEECGTPPEQYGEIKMVCKETGVTGSVDLLYLERNAFTPVEIKSINRKGWEDLTRPQPAHLQQVLWYWYLLTACGYPVHDRIIILYATKDSVGARNPYREFVLQPSKLIDRISELKEDAIQYKHALADPGHPLPPNLCCPTSIAPAAKKCDVCSVCFAG